MFGEQPLFHMENKCYFTLRDIPCKCRGEHTVRNVGQNHLQNPCASAAQRTNMASI